MRPSSSTSDGLFGPLFDDPDVTAAVSDAALVRAMLDTEAALAQAGADAGVVPADAATAIAATCRDPGGGAAVDPAELGRAAVEAGNPVVPLVRLLSAAVPEPARPWVHHGATSQDVLDTAFMLVSRDAVTRIRARLGAAAEACARLAAEHRDTVMVARTLGQQAVPTTFGRKAAGWLVGLDMAEAGLDTVLADGIAVQLGGAAGTLAGLGPAGPAVVTALAGRLGLAAPVLPWHTDRQRVLALAAGLGGTAVAAGKVAADVLGLAQTEVAEVTLASAGGSSAMPHKRNPVTAVLLDAGVRRVPGLVATLYAAAVHEQERAAGAWHAEWQPWRELLVVVGGVTRHLEGLLTDLRVRPERMRANLDLTGGLVMAESLAARLAPALGRNAAHDLVAAAAARSRDGGRPFADVVLADAGIGRHLAEADVRAALDPAGWLGAAPALTDAALAAHAALAARAAVPAGPAGGTTHR